MGKALLLISGSRPSGGSAPLAILWEERGAGPGEISLPALLDQWLLEIRAEHMRWAWETGFAPFDGSTLATGLERGQKPSMWWTSLIYERHPRLSPHLYPLYKLRCLERLILERGLDELEVQGGDKTLKRILATLAESGGWSIEFHGRSRAPSQKGLGRRLYEAAPAPLRACARFCHWLLAIRRRLPLASGLARTEDGFLPATIATYFPNIDLKAAGEGRFRSRYWESLHDAINQEARCERPNGPHFVRWLLIRFPSPELSFGQCLKLKRLFQKEGRDGLEFHYLEEFLGFREIAQSLWRWLSLCVQSARAQRGFKKSCRFKGSRLDFWPLLKWEWAESFRGWRCLERCLQNSAFIKYASVAGKERWTLYPLENCPWERMLVQAFRDQNASHPLYGTQHSIVRPTDFRYFDDPRSFGAPEGAFQPDIIGGNGSDACSQWLTNGMPAGRQRELEALRYLYLARDAEPANGAAYLPPEPGEPLADAGRLRLLVLTSFFKDETREHLRLLGEALDAGLFSGWSLVLKPHPYLPVNDWLDKRPESQKRLIRLATGPMALELAPGISVWASNSTTAALEAVIKGLPVMVMRPVRDFDLCPIQNIPGLARTGSLAEVRGALASLAPLPLPRGYLDLNPGLEAWRGLLGLECGKRQGI